ncbi:XRE family transcriptional regulator [Flammeovirgaceae bacterium SG7u.111]|nr:XRE family transcriptional regulator [Flammeovirgaceae bacterium SG7u.132]WPO37925.1 XRE family transcriptional regulator [Flammeovirgaceae bacterium SG7u.111]
MAIKSDRLGNIGKVIKEIRKQNSMNLQTVATKSEITPSLLSKIENFRTVPSLPVLFNIAKALEVDLTELVKGVSTQEADYVLIKKENLIGEERHDSVGLTYFDILSQNVTSCNIRVNLVRAAPEIYRPPVSTAATELIHVLKGKVVYSLDEKVVELHEGDTLLFDGNIAHSVENQEKKEALMFKVYFMDA